MFGFLKKRKRTEFEEAVLPYLDVLFNAALRLTHNEREAEDLVQDSLVKAFRFFHRFEPGTNIKAWLFKIQTNTYINHYRKKQREREILEEVDAEDPQYTSEFTRQVLNPEENIINQFMSTEVKEALARLPVEFRTVLILADLEDFSYKEIAEIVDCPIGTVMSRLYRGRKMLRQFLYDFAVREGYIQPLEQQGEGKVTDLSSYRLRRKSQGKGQRRQSG